jgi:hypothetical protein
MDREWMYKTSRLDPSFLDHVRKKFFPVAQKHRLSLGQERMISCNSCKNLLTQKDSVVQSHLIRFGFVKDPEYKV